MKLPRKFPKALKPFLSWPVGVAFLAGALIFGVAGWFVPSPIEAARYEGASLRLSASGYQFIRPLLTCDIASQEAFTDLDPLKSRIQDTIDQAKNAGKVDSVSVYFRSMRDSHWFDLNPDETYAPASLLKVFVMMAYLKSAEAPGNAGLLDKQFAFEQSDNPVIEVPGEVIPHLVKGQAYTVRQLIAQMIIYSDNDALNTLVDNADAQTLQALQQIFSDLKIASPVGRSQQIANYMPVDQYATVFRVLNGATYLSRDDSEAALKLLSQAHYDQALAAGVPAGVSVAHKFGVSPGVGEEQPELHDCGIVYYPQHSYLLCVMTRGSDFASLQQLIKAISAETYQAVAEKYPAPAASTTPAS